MHRNVYWEKRTNNISFDILKGNKNEHVIEKEKLHQKLIFDIGFDDSDFFFFLFFFTKDTKRYIINFFL